MNRIKIKYQPVLVAVMVVALAGCASPSSEWDFGNSVRKMVAAQKHVPEGQEPPAIPTMDGARAAGAVERQRTTPPAQHRIYQGMGGAEL
ncbi:hypothetical protein [Marinobacter qingdaonensis]|uniref:Lipoprotein n=1 Tax=Marinobacter qingdaonensis TaxID=3108486 RepID=A0ABU5P273_9GAMM|nr:hypothetical protein [Marinobacter sp. ASW11-75]MEA1082173.1 hypothetical protein [Marinobacter sp. ASW11-75]MEE3117471.1 hypothetical protein [Pseudomonadota bacterium]